MSKEKLFDALRDPKRMERIQKGMQLIADLVSDGDMPITLMFGSHEDKHGPHVMSSIEGKDAVADSLAKAGHIIKTKPAVEVGDDVVALLDTDNVAVVKGATGEEIRRKVFEDMDTRDAETQGMASEYAERVANASQLAQPTLQVLSEMLTAELTDTDCRLALMMRLEKPDVNDAATVLLCDENLRPGELSEVLKGVLTQLDAAMDSATTTPTTH